jgi:hypothetical protein
VVNQSAASEGGLATANATGGFTFITDTTSATSQSPDVTTADTYAVTSNGTFSTGSSAGAIIGIVISSSQFVLLSPSSLTALYPTLLLFQQ